MLAPLSILFGIVAFLRRSAFRIGLLRSVRLGRPVIVVGNISVGGTGKTPLVIWITEFLQAKGATVGVVTRGYGGAATLWPQVVTKDSSAQEVGDEAVLIAMRTGTVVVAGPDRIATARRAIELGATVIVSDDGLQHYRLARDCEIVVIDAERQVGNGWLLPAGPLRERATRLQRGDLVVATQRGAKAFRRSESEVAADHRIVEAQCITTGERRPLPSFAGAAVHAVAGIGNPEAFFAMLRAHGLQIDPRALPDHAQITAADVSFADGGPVLMTEKDAVKCRAFANGQHWAVRLDVTFNLADSLRIAETLKKAMNVSVSNSITR
ncbi:MAG TPA: tetraacyldisaccharide 4'-kinase [Steroidobacteraceae bacterium]|nr:tetraacyldisaccharide 4'-kinase [Steroidobacteraceae bacterium]